MPNTRLNYVLYLMPLFMIIVRLIDPIQIQGQPITDNNTGKTHMMPPYMSEDQCNDPNSPVGSADDVPIPCKNMSTPQTPEGTACFDATPDGPTICRKGPVGSQDVN
ncbi:MAG: hypothetical protein ACHQ1D_10590 [Nitrososphaerales archaeon]